MGYILTTLVVGVTLAAYADVRTRRIPNALCGALAIFAIAANAARGGPSGAAIAALVMVTVFLAGTVAFSLGWFGGGDVKLLAASCGVVGYSGAVDVVLYTLAAGGVLALLEAARQGRLREVLLGTYMATRGVAPTSRTRMPYGIAIATGAYLYALSALSNFHFLRLPV